jgi:hypothetical protein
MSVRAILALPARALAPVILMGKMPMLQGVKKKSARFKSG